MDAILKNNFKNILAGYELVKDYTVSGSAITSYDFTGLNITKEDDYMLVSDIYNPTGTTFDTYLQFNNTSGYYEQRLVANGTSVSAERSGSNYFGFVLSGNRTLGIAKIKLTNNGYCVAQGNFNRTYGTSSLVNINQHLTSTFTTTSITSIKISAGLSSGIGVGSRFQLYKRVAPIIADITVSSATTSVDITGFTMDKGSEYMLVSTLVNSTATETDPIITINGNDTSTNYYSQYLNAESSSVSSDRLNSPILQTHKANSSRLSYINLKLTNNGYYTYQANSARNIGGSTVFIGNVYGTSTFTASSISSIKITSSASNISVGSRFQLIKLK